MEMYSRIIKKKIISFEALLKHPVQGAHTNVDLQFLLALIHFSMSEHILSGLLSSAKPVLV